MGFSLLYFGSQASEQQEASQVEKACQVGTVCGFLRQHSSTVALVHNLHTGYISPQYHVIFDDKFETVFSGEKFEEEMDKICQKLFDGKKEAYVEEGYDSNGVLIYETPPLDEVCLSEPERRDHQDALRRHRHITRRREELRSKEIKKKVQFDHVPALAESDVDSDDDSQSDDSGDDALNLEEGTRQRSKCGAID